MILVLLGLNLFTKKTKVAQYHKSRLIDSFNSSNLNQLKLTDCLIKAIV